MAMNSKMRTIATTAETARQRKVHSAARCQSGAGARVSFGGRIGGTLSLALLRRFCWAIAKAPSGVVTLRMKASRVDEQVPRL